MREQVAVAHDQVAIGLGIDSELESADEPNPMAREFRDLPLVEFTEAGRSRQFIRQSRFRLGQPPAQSLHLVDLEEILLTGTPITVIRFSEPFLTSLQYPNRVTR